jgi:hypothetical protein
VPQGEEFDVARRGRSGADEGEVDQQAEGGVQGRQRQRHLSQEARGTLADPLGLLIEFVHGTG